MDALLAGLKSVTRRDWPDDYAGRFCPGSSIQAYDRSAHNGGKCRAIIRLEAIHREPLARLTDDPSYGRTELIKEGNLWAGMDDSLALFGKLKHGDPFRLRFSLVDIVGKQTSLPLADPAPAVHAEFCRLTSQEIKLSLFQGRWKELLHTQGFSPDDVALTAHYLIRQVNQGKRQDGCLRLFNFANPVLFASDLALARKSKPQRSQPGPAATAPVLPPPDNNIDPKLPAKFHQHFRRFPKGA